MRYIICVLLIGVLALSCKEDVKIYNLTGGYMDSCFKHKGECKPLELNRHFATQKIMLNVRNQFTLDNLDSSARGYIKEGKPVMGLYLSDSKQVAQIGYGTIPWDSLTIIRKVEVGIGRDISLDLKGVPDGKYAVILHTITDEYPVDFSIIIKTN